MAYGTINFNLTARRRTMTNTTNNGPLEYEPDYIKDSVKFENLTKEMELANDQIYNALSELRSLRASIEGRNDDK